MAQQKVLYLKGKFGPWEVGTGPVPKPGPGEVLIRVEATAINPVDWKLAAYGVYLEVFPAIIGGDAAGVVEEVGEGVANLEKGDRVMTNGIYGTNDHATFQQYTLGYADVTAKIPENISFDQASTIPLGLATAAVGLFHQDPSAGAGIFPPWEDGGRGRNAGKPILVTGGAGSVGQYAIQLLKLSGFSPIITTASPRNTAYLKGLGATHVLDRSLAADALIAEVRRITAAPLPVVYDTISQADTQDVARKILAPGGTLVLSLEVNDAVKGSLKAENKRAVYVVGNTNVPQNRKMGAGLYAKLTAMLEEGALKPNLVECLPDGLHGVIVGLEKLKQGVSNVKLVGHPQETA